MNRTSTYQRSRVIHRPLVHGVKLGASMTNANRPLPWYVECSYYFLIFHGTVGAALGVQIPFIGAGMLLLLAGFCVKRLQLQRETLYGALALPLATAFSYLIVQLAVHNQPLSHPYVRPFVSWILTVVLIQSLCLRQGFLHRFALVIFVIGLIALPSLELQGSIGHVERAAIENEADTTLGNPNSLAYWFGFCAVYFITATIENKHALVRMICSLCAVGCLGVMGLTVSRGALLAVGTATIVALRRVLKRGVFPVFLALALAVVSYESGLFDRVVSSYSARAMEETGRLLVWPLVIERFLSSPLVGVGASDTGTYVYKGGEEAVITPHNSLLFIAVASGVIPLVLFVAYWWRAVLGAIRSSRQRVADSSFLLPLLSYGFVMIQGSNLMFVFPYVITPLSLAMLGAASQRKRRVVLRRAGIGRRPKATARSREAVINAGL